MSIEAIDYNKLFKPSTTPYPPGEGPFLVIGQGDVANSVFFEWLGIGRIVVKIDGKEYKQTIQEFIDNCTKGETK